MSHCFHDSSRVSYEREKKCDADSEVPEEAGDDAAFIAKALGTIARAKGMTQLANETGLGRESLYKALSGEGNPSFATILKVMTALGIKLHAEKAHVA